MLAPGTQLAPGAERGGKYSLRKDKCEFAFNSMEVLGFVVDGESVCASPDNVSKVFEFPVPTTRKELQPIKQIFN